MAMDFYEARAVLIRRTGAPVGATADHGPYYERAKTMTFQQHPRHRNVFEAIANRNMWLYFSVKTKQICCGDKPHVNPRTE
jgi:hypothetical protein